MLSLIFIATLIVWDSDYMPRPKFDSFLLAIRGTVSFKDWLPVDARELTALPKMNENVEAASRKVAVEVWEPEYRKFTISDGDAADVRVKTFYYPTWTASADGATLPLRPSAEGVTLIAVPAGATTVEMMFREPVKVKIAGMISGLAWIVIIVCCALGYRKTSKRSTRVERNFGRRAVK